MQSTPQLDEHGRPQPPPLAGEVDTLLGFLDFQRATLAWKVDGLDEAGLRTTVGVSTMTLGGILTHLSWVEDFWFTYRLRGDRPTPPWDTVDWDADPDADWHLARDLTPEQIHERWTTACGRSRGNVAEALAAGGLDGTAAVPERGHGDLGLRWIVVHMIEEYARHVGHADLLREAVDGRTGE